MPDPALRARLRNGLFLAEASAAAYLEEREVRARYEGAGGARVVAWIDRSDTQAFVGTSARAAFVAFRGTEIDLLGDWLTDLQTQWVPGPHGRVHAGFHVALEAAWGDLLAALDDPDVRGRPLHIAGHSLGGALAVLAASRLSRAGRPAAGVWTYGQPRVGDADFCLAYDEALGEATSRFVHNVDVVPRVPPRRMGYGHAGTLLFLGPRGGCAVNPPLWAQLLAQFAGDAEDAAGRLSELKEMVPRGVEDHAIERYVERIRACAAGA